jgi:hypothetical protein
MPAEADRQWDQLRGVLQELGATLATLITVLSEVLSEFAPASGA